MGKDFSLSVLLLCESFVALSFPYSYKYINFVLSMQTIVDLARQSSIPARNFFILFEVYVSLNLSVPVCVCAYMHACLLSECVCVCSMKWRAI